MTIDTHVRRRAVAATALGAVLALSACGSGSDGAAEGESTEAAGGFPASVDTEFGKVTVEEKPETIVVIGSPLDVDMLDALGEPADVYGGWGPEDLALQTAPWIEGLYDEYAADLIADSKPSAEAVAEQDPDLIIYFGAGSPLDQSGFDQLTEIAPTYAYTQLPTHEDELDALGTLTGTTDQVEKVVQGIDDDFAEARETLSGLEGKTFFQGVTSPDGIYSVSGANHFFSELGLEPSKAQPTEDKTQTLSLERLDDIDADVAVIGGEDDARKEVEDDSRFDRLPAVENDAMVLVGGTETYLSMPTQIGPSSVPYILGKLVPQLEDSTLNQGS
ncbi:ABC transporter substrate-binding protein [Brevibacterium atlanticum]|uniref:ABC transporter substrate-binding protein n=1 Tax=Brevibacterium atlanticum TaxID=2697563 RepID=UPI00141F3771|nr:ABC transporter substrate-binding protein [Brevibacterium atlanticum]